MSFLHRFGIVFVISLLSANSLFGQDDKSHLTLSFDEKGKLEDAVAWGQVKADIQKRKPKHVFLVCHGWLTSKTQADKTFTYFGEELRKAQGKDDPIEVIGVRWPSLIGENDTEQDQAFKTVAKVVSVALAKSETLKEKKGKLKSYLKTTTARLLVAGGLKFRLPSDEQIDLMIDNLEQVDNVERVLSTFTYYEMKRRAGVIGTNGLQRALTELQDELPDAQFHLVGHSFGCKVCLECLASKEREKKQVDSVILLQAAVSQLCFAAIVGDVEGKPAGAYVDVPKRVRGPIAVTHTTNDVALSVVYPLASTVAWQIAELPGGNRVSNYERYAALGANGVVDVAGIERLLMKEKDAAYKLRPGLNGVNADRVIQNHNDYRRSEVTALIWSAARSR